MKTRNHVAGVFCHILGILCITQMLALVITSFVFDIQDVRKGLLIVIIALALIYSNRVLRNISVSHPEFHYESEIDEYYNTIPDLFRYKGYLALYIASRIVLQCVWMMSFVISELLMPEAIEYLTQVFDGNEFYVAGLYAMPSFLSIDGVFASWSLGADITDSFPSTIGLKLVLIAIIIALSLLAGIASYARAITAQCSIVKASFGKEKKNDN